MGAHDNAIACAHLPLDPFGGGVRRVPPAGLARLIPQLSGAAITWRTIAPRRVARMPS
ncbi:hypothetical protein KZ829_12385 [Actinoplanes hulinensis]|uniref:Uncharacterized protein n=1 Tax=Actinoplanes hulinensis TaxID=1144547 RepID=A0ABS7B0G6_9ACTN|nr:hypothetical protein [Actinoplanes hulinensis]MBW6434530.1 hypothetical protein [Actinoplanes hulinensis]